MNDVNCPYCKASLEINHDDGRGRCEGETHQQQCRECDKYFVFTTTIIFYYDVEKADCLNDGEHKFKPVRHGPKYYPDWVRCVTCDEEKKGNFDADVVREVLK